MNNLFVYGCSFTACRETNPEHVYYDNYKKDDDDNWPNLIGKSLNLNVYNFGEGLFSNDKIIDSVINSFDLITEGDLIILQMSFNHRFDIPDFNNKRLFTIAPNPENLLNNFYLSESEQKYSKDEIEHLSYVTTLMDGELIGQRNINRFNFIKKILVDYKKTKCIIWDMPPIGDKYQTIYEATNGKINDNHWSFKGCKDFSKYILNKL
jgi:hypothetical protein